MPQNGCGTLCFIPKAEKNLFGCPVKKAGSVDRIFCFVFCTTRMVTETTKMKGS